jgi:hypothetical protein
LGPSHFVIHPTLNIWLFAFPISVTIFHHQRRRVRIHRSSPSQKSSSPSPIPSFIAITELFTIAGNNTSPSPATTQHRELIQPSSTFNRNKHQKDENKTGSSLFLVLHSLIFN